MARYFYTWLVKRKDRLVPPLATCRLMLAPSDEEIKEQPEIEKLKTPCTMDDFLVQANAWRKDASARKEGTTIFYFAGNGFQVEKSDPVLRLAISVTELAPYCAVRSGSTICFVVWDRLTGSQTLPGRNSISSTRTGTR